MKYFNILCFLLFVSFSANAQKTTSDTTGPDIIVPAEAPISSDDPVFTVVEQMPMFKGGDEALLKFIKDNVKYPAGINNTKEIVYVGFVLNKEGKPEIVKVLRSTNEKCNTEAIRVIQSMPDWIPGIQNGKPANVYISVPVIFRPNN